MNPSDVSPQHDAPLSGWIRLYRQLLNHPLWQEKRRFSKAEAWIDLLLLANYKDRRVCRGNKVITVKRGQVLTSQVELAAKWRWARNSVNRFLTSKNLGIEVSIETVKGIDKGYTLITLENYDKYQGSLEEQPSEVGTALSIEAGIGRASREHRVSNNKNVKNVKKYTTKAHKGTSVHQEIMDLYHTLFTEKFGTPPLILGKRDGRIIQELLKARKDAEEVKRLLRFFFVNGTRWVREQGKYDLPTFRAVYNELLVLVARGDA